MIELPVYESIGDILRDCAFGSVLYWVKWVGKMLPDSKID